MLALLIATALGADCTYVSKADVLSVPAPAVIVLGERHATQPDLRRAGAVVKSYAARMRTRVALEAVRAEDQAVLDRFTAGQIDAASLPDALDWGASWGFDWAPYRPLVTSSQWGATVVGAGLKLGPKPEDATIPVPPRYMDLLREAMGGHPIPLGQENSFVESMAWRDHGIAKAALDGWDGKGWLIIVTGRGHVEGGKGVAWQASQLTATPVSSFVLSGGGGAACHPGDRVWR